MAIPSSAPTRRVLLTGHTGFTGQYVAEELRGAGYDVCGLVVQGADIDTLEPEQVDLLDEASVHRAVQHIQPDAVIHLAGIAFASHGDADAIYQTNLIGTRHLLTALADLPVAPVRVVLASTAHAYGNATHAHAKIKETAPLHPISDYAVSKVAMEFMAKTWSMRLPIVLTRPFNYTGVGQDSRFLIPKIVEHYRRNERKIELGNLDVWREFNDVRAVAWIYRRLLETDGDDDTLNICAGKSYSLREVIGMMSQIAGYDIEVSVNPAFVRENEVHRLEGDPARLEARVGPIPHSSLAATLKWMYESR